MSNLAVHVDVNELANVEQMARIVLETFGRIDILVNAFGTNSLPIPGMGVSEPEFQRVLGINLTGVFRCCRTVGEIMRGRGHGVIPPVLSIPYNVSRSGVLSLSRILAYELVPFNVQVNAVAIEHPGVRFGPTVCGPRDGWPRTR